LLLYFESGKHDIVGKAPRWNDFGAFAACGVCEKCRDGGFEEIDAIPVVRAKEQRRCGRESSLNNTGTGA
jgi:NADH:ubiquinone oxidoreductase subunit F (NADH-binding)